MEYGVNDNSFQAAGGKTGIFILVENFYRHMDTLNQARCIRQMHPEDLSQSIDKLALFLCAWLGGPKLYQEKYGSINIPKFHQSFKIGEREKDLWLLCMEKALETSNYQPEFKKYLLTQLNIPASRCINH